MRFGDLYLVPSRNGLTKPRAIRGSGIKFINMGELFEYERIGAIQMDRVPVTEKELTEAQVQEGDLLFARQSLVREGAGKCSIVLSVTEPTTFDSHLIRVRLNQTIACPEFYRFYFASHLSPIPGIVSQCAQAGIKGNDLKELDVLCPPLDKQERIAEILSAYDKLIENNRKQIKLLEEAVQRLYKEWFIDLKFPGHETTPIDPTTNLPEGWKSDCFLDAIDYVRGKSYSTENLIPSGTLKLVNLNNIHAWGGWSSGAEKPFEGPFKPEQLVSGGELIMSVTDMTKERRLVGHAARVPGYLRSGLISMDLIKLVPKKVETSYLYATLRFSGLSKMISFLANGTNVLHLKPDALSRVNMVVPSLEIQKHFSAIINPAFDKIDLLEEQITDAQEARDRLLPVLMNADGLNG